MLELGQPLHAFDRDNLQGGITVRLAREAERLKLLDGQEVALRPETLVIADERGPLAMAGIMGEKFRGKRKRTRFFLSRPFLLRLALLGRRVPTVCIPTHRIVMSVASIQSFLPWRLSVLQSS